MLSNELVIIILIFLAYMAIWFGGINKVMNASQQGMYMIHKQSVVNYVKYVADSVCVSATNTQLTIEFNREENIELSNNEIKIGDETRKLKCVINGNGNIKGKEIKVEKIDKNTIKFEVVE